jgi:predicted  nucleic acid-binding Zn-ribbon protein
MNKLKVRCTVCGKSFKTPSAKKTVCPSCDAEAKRAKHQHVPAVEQRPVDAVSRVDVRAVLRAGQENRGEFAAYKAPPTPTVETPAEPASKQGAAKPAGRQGRSVHPERAARPAAGVRPPRPPREPKPRVVQKPFEPSQEQIEAIRHRYMELAHPEFDGIRHAIATELGIPLRVVKQKVKELREEKTIASWWESGQMLPTPDQIELVRAFYTPHLPEPAVGIHKEIAKELKLANTSVYLAIGQIRRDMDLPRYNARPDLAEQEVVESDEPAEQELAEVGAGEVTGTAARTHGGE